MTLKKRQMLSLAVVLAGIVMMLVGRYTAVANEKLAIAGVLVTFVGFALYGRLACCPNCHKPLEKGTNKHCRHCGARIDF